MTERGRKGRWTLYARIPILYDVVLLLLMLWHGMILLSSAAAIEPASDGVRNSIADFGSVCGVVVAAAPPPPPSKADADTTCAKLGLAFCTDPAVKARCPLRCAAGADGAATGASCAAPKGCVVLTALASAATSTGLALLCCGATQLLWLRDMLGHLLGGSSRKPLQAAAGGPRRAAGGGGGGAGDDAGDEGGAQHAAIAAAKAAQRAAVLGLAALSGVWLVAATLGLSGRTRDARGSCTSACDADASSGGASCALFAAAEGLAGLLFWVVLLKLALHPLGTCAVGAAGGEEEVAGGKMTAVGMSAAGAQRP